MCKLEKVPNGPAAGCFFEGSFAFHLRRPADVAWPDRQGAAHAHGAFFFGDNAYVTDLGGDAIWHYKVLSRRQGGNP